jgi:hypothetical protein
VEHTIHRHQTLGLQKAETGVLAIDSLAELWPHLGALQESRDHPEPVERELPPRDLLELQVQDQVHVPEEPEGAEAEAEEEPRDSQARVALVEMERSFCTGRSTSACTVTFWSPRA